MEKWKKNISIFMIGQLISLIGSLIVQYAIVWHIILETNSGLMMTFSILASFIPTFLLSPFAGVWADRVDRKKLMVTADLMIAAVTLIVAVILWSGYYGIWLLFVLIIFRSFGQAVHQPAVSAAYPTLVPKDKLMRVQGINQAIQSASIILVPILAGVLIVYFDFAALFLIDVITAILAVSTLIFLVKIPKLTKNDNNKIKYFNDIKAGLKYVASSKLLAPVLTFIFFFNIMIAPVAFLSPIQVVRAFGDQSWYLVAIEIAFGAGMLVGSLIISAWGGFKNRLTSCFLASIILGAITVIMGVPFNLWFYFSLMAVVGLFLPMLNTPFAVLLQEKVDPDYLGRVFSIVSLINTIGMPLGMLVFGPLADVININTIILTTGIAALLIGIIPLLNKRLMAQGLPSKKVDEVSHN